MIFAGLSYSERALLEHLRDLEGLLPEDPNGGWTPTTIAGVVARGLARWEKPPKQRPDAEVALLPTAQGLAALRWSGSIGRPRKFDPLKVGDIIGSTRVIALLPRGWHGRSDERVRVSCFRGHMRDVFVHNLRKHSKCPRCPRPR